MFAVDDAFCLNHLKIRLSNLLYHNRVLHQDPFFPLRSPSLESGFLVYNFNIGFVRLYVIFSGFHVKYFFQSTLLDSRMLYISLNITLFAGLAMTASAYSVPDCSVHHTGMGSYGYVTCPNCGSSKAMKYICKYSPSCNHYFVACTTCNYFGGII